MYLWQAAAWPHFQFNAQALAPALAQARRAQGRMLGLASSLQRVDLGELQLGSWAQEAVATAQIEGEVLPLILVRASAARRLGLADAPARARDARTEATLDMLQAAVRQWARPLTPEDLFDWQAALFPSGRSGLTRIVTGAWRIQVEPTQIVTPRLGQPDVVHYQAPDSADVPVQMAQLLAWFSRSQGSMDGLLRAALAHLWFEAIHPFDAGNGRIGRALAELALAQDMQSSQRLFSLSQQLGLERSAYYARLQAATAQPDMDVTPWVQWFVGCVEKACQATLAQMQTALAKTRYWAQVNASFPGLTPSQRKALGRLFDAQPDGFVGGLSSEKYVKLTGVSPATADCELTQLSERGLLEKTGQGRGTRYQLQEGAG